MVAEPIETPVTGTRVLVELAPILTVAGTLATPGALEPSCTNIPLGGAGAVSISVIFCVDVPVIVSPPGEKLMAAGRSDPPDAVIVTVAGLLFVEPVLSITCGNE